MSRHVTLAGIRNFRDFGDYGAGARRIKKGVLYRSAHHSEATDDDLAAIAALNPAVIVDLRRRGEREQRPSRRWDGFSARVIENDIDDENQEEYETAWLNFLSQPRLEQQAIWEWGYDWYARTPFETRHVDLFSRYFRALGDADGPVLIHCAAGKDRTGVLAALTHHLAGASRDDIVADYLLTNHPETMARGQKEILGWLGEKAPHNAHPEIARSIITITPEHLDATFDAINAKHGSIDNYLTRELGVDAKLRGAIEKKILE